MGYKIGKGNMQWTTPSYKKNAPRQEVEDNKQMDPNYVKLGNRESTKWNLWVELTPKVKLEDIIDTLKAREKYVTYAHVSGPERGKCKLDRPIGGKWISADYLDHVHVVLVLKEPVAQWLVCNNLVDYKIRGRWSAQAIHDKQSVIAKLLYHRRAESKTGLTKTEYETGKEPVDDIEDPDIVEVVHGALQTYGLEEDREKYKAYWERHTTNKEAAKAGKLKPTSLFVNEASV